MNQQFHNNQQSLKVTKKQAGVSKLFDWSKNFTAHMFNIKLKEKSYKWTSKCYRLKYSGQKTDCPPPPLPPRADKVKLLLLDYWTIFRENNVNKTVFFLVLLKYREIKTVKTEALYKKLYFFMKSLKSKKNSLGFNLFYYVSREIRLDDSEKFICLAQSRF